jgi:GH43 family beta-xylosidase
MDSFRVRLWASALLSLALMASHAIGAQTFTNPVLKGADPSVILVGGTYYSIGSGCPDPQLGHAHGNICIRSSPTLVGLGAVTPVVVWRAPLTGPNSADVWAPDLEYFDGQWYIYYAADSGSNDHHLFALVPDVPGHVLGTWSFARTDGPVGELPINWTSQWGIDPDVFLASDHKLYLTYACRPTDNPTAPNWKYQGICLSAMSNPLHLTGKIISLSSPTQPWETRNYPTEEGPVGFTHNGVDYIVFSASFSGSPDSYAEGILINDRPPQPGGAGNPLLNSASWRKVGPIFDGHHTAYGTASVVLVDSSDHTELWNVYHGVNCLTDCPPGVLGTWRSRSDRMQQAYWSASGELVLGYPVDIVTKENQGEAVSLDLPSTSGRGSRSLPAWGPAFGDAAEGDTTEGLKVGEWASPEKMPTAAGASISSKSLDPRRYDQIFFGANPNLLDYVLSTDVQLVLTGKDDPAPKYGVYGAYVDHRNFYVAMLDVTVCPAPGCLATDAFADGVDQGWKNCPLPQGFDPAKPNHLVIEAISGGYSLFINDMPLSGPCQDRRFFLDHGQSAANGSNGQVGAVVEDTEASFTNFNVSYGVPQDSQTASQGFNTTYNLNLQQTYSFRSQTSRMNLDNHCYGCKGGSATNSQVVQYPPFAPYPTMTSPTQLWTLRGTGGGHFMIRSVLSGKCLANLDKPQTGDPDANLEQLPCKNTASQNWLFTPRGDGNFSIGNQASSLVLESGGGREQDPVRLRHANGSSAQNWLLVIQ